MNSYGLGNGEWTPEEVEEQEQRKASLLNEEAYAASQQAQESGQPPAQSPTGEQQPQQQQQQPEATAQAQQSEEPDTSEQRLARKEAEEQQAEVAPTEQFAPWDEGYDAGDGARTAAELALAAPTGAIDFSVDLINKIPGVNIPKLPTFQSESTQTVREIGNLLFGTWAATRGARGLTKAAGAKVAPKMPNMPPWLTRGSGTVRRIGEAAAGGYAAELVADTKLQQDETVMGELKQASWVPGWMKDNIPDNWTNTGISDPDVRRQRNRDESLGIGIILDGAIEAAKVVRGVFSTRKIAKGLSETQASWDRQLIALNGKNVAEVTGTAKNLDLPPVQRGIANTEDALDELGVAAAKTDPEAFSKPTKGLHDAFDPMENGVVPVSKDGVVGALADQVQIRTNTGSFWGRVGNVISDAWAKRGPISKGKTPVRQLVDKLVDQVKEIQDVEMILPSGIKVDATEFNRITDMATMEELSDAIFEVKDIAQVKGMLNRFRDTAGTLSGIKNKNVIKGLDDAIRRVGEELYDIDRLKVQNIVQQSAAGQVADTAEALRLAGSDPGVVTSVSDQTLSKLVYLLTERGMWRSRVGSELSWFNIGDIKRTKSEAENLIFDLNAAEMKAYEDAKKFTTTLAQIQANQPEFLKPLWLAYELTDGKVKTLYDVSEYMKENLSGLQKALVDGNPAMPNQLVAGIWSNVYNSVLSSFATPIRAAIGNIGGLIAKPVTVLGGAALGGDIKTLRRGAMAMGAVWESMSQASVYMGEVFRKVSTDPYSYGQLARKDIIATPDSGTLEALKGFAKASEANGELGPAFLVMKVEELNDMAASPFLRFGSNAMSALDGFTKSMVANMEARYLAMDELALEGLEVNMKNVSAKAKKYYDEAKKLDFGANTQDYVNVKPEMQRLMSRTEYQTGEIALNLDSDMSRWTSNMLQKAPGLKPFLMFPRTSFNMIEMFDKYSPVSIFAREANEVALTRNINMVPEAKIRQTLLGKGLISQNTPFEEVLQRFKMYQAEVRGRKAIGGIVIGGAATLALQGKMTGYGVTDEETQRAREKLGIPKMSFFNPETNIYQSYEGLGPITDLLASTATIFENRDLLGYANTEKQLATLQLIVGASITDRSVMKNIGDLLAMTKDPAQAFTRVSAQMANGIIPLAGQRAEWGRFMNEALKEHDKSFQELLRNRNKVFTKLPTQYDFLYGDPVGTNVDPRDSGDWIRVFINATTPFKTRSGPRPEGAFLADIEYDMRPMLSTDGNGIPYPPELRSQINKIIADNGVFLKQVKKEMKFAERTQWPAELRQMRRDGVTSDQISLKNFKMSHERLTRILNAEAKRAENYLSSANKQLLAEARLEMKRNKFAARKGEGPKQYMEESKNFK